MSEDRSPVPTDTNPGGPDTLRAMREASGGAAGSGPRISLIIYHGDQVQAITLAGFEVRGGATRSRALAP